MPDVSCRKGGGVALGMSGVHQFKPDMPRSRYEPRLG